tara:strand:+ start:2294 stop:4633 length:2340 start_codon:yes stop_codon:yes gene_type:complete
VNPQSWGYNGDGGPNVEKSPDPKPREPLWDTNDAPAILDSNQTNSELLRDSPAPLGNPESWGYNGGSGFEEGSDNFGAWDAKDTPSFTDYDNSAFQTDAFFSPEVSGQKTQSTQSVQPAQPPPNPDYYVYDRKEAFVKAPFAKNMFGGNLDVAATLEKIDFDPYVDGSLRGCIAYIVPWTRTGVPTRSESLPSAQNAPVDNTVPTSLSNLWNDPNVYKDLPDWSIDSSLLEETSFTDNIVPKWEPNKSAWEAASIAPSFIPPEDLKGKLSTGSYNTYGKDILNNVEITPSAAQQTQDSLKKDTSVGLRQTTFEAGNLLNKTLLDGSPWSNLVDTGLDLFAEATNTPTGPVFAGNPDGILANLFNVARILGNNSSVPKDLSSKASKSTNLFSSAVSNSVAWQFLFNPSQLNLSVGPNFKKSETWGVSDEANSGAPLHWTSNKNAELKFSKVLLNGYVFGKRVEELEQGLIELFMKSPTNDAKHGPRVLEFVWGKKSFGPCVIRDITISEKMWDGGLLVNAEANFTLERVPEWTINDGYVSTYDATAQSTVGIPTKKNPPPSGPDAKEKPADPAAPAPPGPTTQSPGLTAKEQTEFRKCQDALNEAANFGKMRAQMDAWGNIFIGNSNSTKKEIRAMAAKYERLYNKMANEYKREFVGRITNPTAKPALLKKQVTEGLAAFPQFSETDLPIGGSYNRVAKIVYSAANSGNIAMKAISDSKKCKDLRKKNDDINEARVVTAEKKKKCDRSKPGAACSPPGSIGQTCGGARLLCARDSKWQAV